MCHWLELAKATPLRSVISLDLPGAMTLFKFPTDFFVVRSVALTTRGEPRSNCSGFQR